MPTLRPPQNDTKPSPQHHSENPRWQLCPFFPPMNQAFFSPTKTQCLIPDVPKTQFPVPSLSLLPTRLGSGQSRRKPAPPQSHRTSPPSGQETGRCPSQPRANSQKHQSPAGQASLQISSCALDFSLPKLSNSVLPRTPPALGGMTLGKPLCHCGCSIHSTFQFTPHLFI